MAPWPSRAVDTTIRTFPIDNGQITLLTSPLGGFAHFLLYRGDPASSKSVLIGSGCADDVETCVRQARHAARRAGLAG